MLYAIIFNHYYPLFYVPQYTVCGGCMRVCAHTAYRIQQFSKTDRIQHTRIHDFLKRAIILYPKHMTPASISYAYAAEAPLQHRPLPLR